MTEPSVTRYILVCSRDADDYSVSFLTGPDDVGARPTICPNCGAPMGLVQVSGPGACMLPVSK